MKIKSITKTDQFVECPLATLQNDTAEHHVLTPDGWSRVLDFGYIRQGPSKIITHHRGKLVCDPGHVLLAKRHDQRVAIRADQLNSHTDELCTGSEDEDTSPFQIEDGPVEDFYDISIESPHWWYTSGVISHNSILLCNNAVSSISGMGPDGTPGQNVLMITFELDTLKTAMRCLGVATRVSINDIVNDHQHQDYISRNIETMKKTYNKEFAIYEWAPDECSVADIYALLDNLRRIKSFQPDVIVIDYMDLMISRNPGNNDSDYSRQKHVANEIRGLAINENVVVFTATQTNRTASGGGEAPANMSQVAESYGKQFALDYIISLNQTARQRQRDTPEITMYIAKNRNGPRAENIRCEINYDTMIVEEIA